MCKRGIPRLCLVPNVRAIVDIEQRVSYFFRIGIECNLECEGLAINARRFRFRRRTLGQRLRRRFRFRRKGVIRSFRTFRTFRRLGGRIVVTICFVASTNSFGTFGKLRATITKLEPLVIVASTVSIGIMLGKLASIKRKLERSALAAACCNVS